MVGPSENLWAEPIDKQVSDKTFQLRNSPFFVNGVSFMDVVRAQPSSDDLILEFTKVIERRGHSTYMLLVSKLESRFSENWEKLKNHGCTYESKTILIAKEEKILYSVDVPPGFDIYAIYRTLEYGESNPCLDIPRGACGAFAKPIWKLFR
jgi:Domain of unknown function (DUF4265)